MRAPDTISPLVGGALYWLVASGLNSTSTPEGRYWHNDHTINGLPMQNVAGLYVVVALILASIVVGQRTSPVLGWVRFFGVIVGTLAVFSLRDKKRQTASVEDREGLARARGWRFKARDLVLARRWKGIYGRNVYSITAFGVIGGRTERAAVHRVRLRGERRRCYRIRPGALARIFPKDVAKRYGTAPTTDVPLPIQAS